METKGHRAEQPESCIIANPIYDTVFKKLMEHERIVKFFLGTLLNENILSVAVRPQEFTYRKKTEESEQAPENVGYSIYRIDFMVTVETKEGEWKKILVEVQKSWDETDVIRFRNYLAEQYRRVDRINGEDIVLPITTIYILGGRLSGIESPCIKVERQYRDMVRESPLNVKSPFVEKLTHDSYVIQAGRIADERYGTRLNELLRLFEQAHFVEEDSEISKQYTYASNDEDIRFITSVLKEMVADPKEREEIEREAEALRTIDDMYGKTNRKQKRIIEEQEKALVEKDRALVAHKKALVVKDKVIEEQVSVIEEKDKALKAQAKQIEELKRLLNTNN
ncbi:MAG: hypothetical protein LBP64_03070 [Tannerella sp.]|nr:hypothetical protein [Tannerella sp.]